jgi:Ala-tRNA(Pro) deacylase
VLNDTKGAVEIFVDQALWEAESLRCHPLVNTSTLSIDTGDIERFLSATGHSLKVVRIP